MHFIMDEATYISDYENFSSDLACNRTKTIFW